MAHSHPRRLKWPPTGNLSWWLRARRRVHCAVRLLHNNVIVIVLKTGNNTRCVWWRVMGRSMQEYRQLWALRMLNHVELQAGCDVWVWATQIQSDDQNVNIRGNHCVWVSVQSSISSVVRVLCSYVTANELFEGFSVIWKSPYWFAYSSDMTHLNLGSVMFYCKSVVEVVMRSLIWFLHWFHIVSMSCESTPARLKPAELKRNKKVETPQETQQVFSVIWPPLTIYLYGPAC